jgi:hypothetical protein
LRILARFSSIRRAEWNWAEAGWIDTSTGQHVTIHTVAGLGDLLGQPSLDPDEGEAVPVESLRGQLLHIHDGVERLTTGPDGQLCTSTTRGVLTPAPVEIVARQTVGKESHRLAERQAGLRPDESETQVFSRTLLHPSTSEQSEGPERVCVKPDCDVAVSGRRVWCATHAVASSLSKRRWRSLAVQTD